MLKWLREEYENPYNDRINQPIINREYEKSLEEYVVDCFKSISNVLPEIQMTDYKFIVDVDKVDQGNYERIRSNRLKDKQQKYIYMNDSRLGELIMTFHVDYEFEGNVGELEFTRKMLIPIPDENNYFYIKGKRYILQYQITESSTYTTSSALVGKSLLPIKVRRGHSVHKDINGVEWKLSYYDLLIFNKYENFLYFYFATRGWQETLEYFEVAKYIELLRKSDDSPHHTYFRINSFITVKVLTKALESSEYIQGMVGSILGILTNRMRLSEIFDKETWICKIGAFKLNIAKESQKELGNRHIVLLNRMLDEGTKYSLRLTPYNKKDVYAIVRWMIQNYQHLWSKENLDLTNKRLRCNEYVASLLNNIISERIKKFVNTTVNKEEKLITKYNNFFSFRGNEIISKLHSSGLMKFDDAVNDMDFFSRLKVTQKGPNSVGNKSDSKTISSKRRALHPSHLLRLDLNVCGASDPGLNNYLSPYCETDGLYFKGAIPEPESFSIELKREISDIDGEDCPVLVYDPVAYNYVLEELDSISVKGIRPSYQDMVEEELADLDEERRRAEQASSQKEEESSREADNE